MGYSDSDYAICPDARYSIASWLSCLQELQCSDARNAKRALHSQQRMLNELQLQKLRVRLFGFDDLSMIYTRNQYHPTTKLPRGSRYIRRAWPTLNHRDNGE